MATAQAMREQEKTVSWSSIFPSQQVTEQQSALFVKKLLAVAVSSITYLRTIFPEHAFGDRCLEDLNLKILKDDSACPGACQVIQWIKGCFDALDKKYLRMIVIGIYGDAEDPDTVIESYTFKFSYMDKEVSIFRNGNKIASAHTERDTKKATIRLLRTIILLSQTLSSLPDDVMMTMKLLYYDEVTPPDYEPPGFKHTSNDAFNFVDEPLNIKVGDVSTPFHTVKLRIKTDCQQFDMKEDVIAENHKQADNIGLEPVGSPSNEINSPHLSPEQANQTKSPVENDQEKGGITEKKGEMEDMDCDQVHADQPAEDIEQENRVKCPCGDDEDEGLMILCGVCATWQHAVCFDVLKQEEAPQFHICVDCAKGEYSGKCTDLSLANLNNIALQATCLWRRTLLACRELNRILPTTLARSLNIEMSTAQGLVKRLEKEGYIRSTLKGKRLGKVVNKKKLQSEGFQKYFRKRSAEPESAKPSQAAVQQEKKAVDVVENITQQCAKMDVSGKKQLSKKLAKKQGEPRSVKRAISLKDEATEFEISDSQEQGFDDLPLSKRRKASIARSPILV
ncbi:unnamed protein product [Porites lobata]|uniref:HORMA domain-containing protein n=1 Tax=Porites lobata TaxID=104759 RepID=A0ABN8PBS0_9CNID|nr:unnamed protein product [Porites lobata]